MNADSSGTNGAKLNWGNFFNNYMFHPNSKNLSNDDKLIAWLGTVVLGIATLGVVHLVIGGAKVITSSLKKIDPDSQDKNSATARTDQVAQNTFGGGGTSPGSAGAAVAAAASVTTAAVSVTSDVQLQQTDQTLSSRNASLHDEINKLKQELELAQTARDKATAELTAARAAENRVIAAGTRVIATENRAINELVEKGDAQKQAIAAASKAVSDRLRQNEAAETALSSLAADVRYAPAAAPVNAAIINQPEEKIQRGYTALRELKEKHQQDLAAAKAASEASDAKSNETIKALTAAIKEKQDKQDKMEQELTSAKAALEKLQKEKETLQGKNGKLQQALQENKAGIEGDLTKQKALAADLQVKLSQEKAKEALQAKENGALQQKIEELQKQIQKLQQEKPSSQSQLQSDKAALTSENASLRTQVSNQQQWLQDSKTEISKLEGDLANQRTQVTNLQGELAEQKRTVQTLTAAAKARADESNFADFQTRVLQEPKNPPLIYPHPHPWFPGDNPETAAFKTFNLVSSVGSGLSRGFNIPGLTESQKLELIAQMSKELTPGDKALVFINYLLQKNIQFNTINFPLNPFLTQNCLSAASKTPPISLAKPTPNSEEPGTNIWARSPANNERFIEDLGNKLNDLSLTRKEFFIRILLAQDTNNQRNVLFMLQDNSIAMVKILQHINNVGINRSDVILVLTQMGLPGLIPGI
jgi:hypothetical protein